MRELSDYPRRGMEVALVESLVPLRGRRILEVGCGEGRLTRDLATVAASVEAFDPKPEAIAAARRAFAAEGVTNVRFRVGSAERSLSRGRTFDVVLFSWSL